MSAIFWCIQICKICKNCKILFSVAWRHEEVAYIFNFIFKTKRQIDKFSDQTHFSRRESMKNFADGFFLIADDDNLSSSVHPESFPTMDEFCRRLFFQRSQNVASCFRLIKCVYQMDLRLHSRGLFAQVEVLGERAS